jgi:hypothetical protein
VGEKGGIKLFLDCCKARGDFHHPQGRENDGSMKEIGLGFAFPYATGKGGFS